MGINNTLVPIKIISPQLIQQVLPGQYPALMGQPFPQYLRKYMSYVLPLIIVVIYFKGYYDTFAPKGTKLLCIWMGVAALFVLFIGYLAFGRGRSRRTTTKE